MRAIVAALGLAASLAAAGAGAATGPTSLTVAVWASDVSAAPLVRWTIACDPARGTVPRPESACRRVAAGGRALFAPTPENTPCAELFGGAQRAVVKGMVAGSRLFAVLRRRDGCELARWNRVAFLLPRVRGAS